MTMNTALAICEAVGLRGKGAPEWVHLLPIGAVVGRDGRNWRLDDPQGVIAQSRGEIPIDYEHQSEHSRKEGGAAPAAGWITALQARKDGIWGKVEWTARGAEMVRNREYRFLSPAMRFDPVTKQIKRIISAGLVHHPNLELTALSSEETPMSDNNPDALRQIAQAIGLNGDAGTAEIVAAITDRAAPDPSRYVPVEAVSDLLRQRNGVVAQNSQRAAEAQVAAAMDAGYITPGMRDWALSLCSRDPDSFDAFLSSALPAYAHIKTSQFDRAVALNSESRSRMATGAEDSICQQLGLRPDDLK